MIIGRKAHRRQMARGIALGGTIAAAAGYLAGILTAPKSGHDTRQDIKKAAEKGVSTAQSDFKKLGTEADKAFKEARTKAGQAGTKAKQEMADLLDKAETSRTKAAEVFTAVRKGDASDEDLARAVKQARHALANLRAYIKK